ncbi:MAG: hypothetical protein KC502_17470 [Myxococcales bacterium]|nr:hypothetical protein [Myxococcales bacterium]
MSDTFRLQGRLCDTFGNPASEFFLAIVDQDMLDEDDLLGLGMTREDGSFDFSFQGSEFRQDFFETESTPDLHLVVSVRSDGALKAIFERSFPSVAWDNGRANLGDIVLDGVDLDSPTHLDGVDATPGYSKRAQRLDIDNDLVSHCMAEVAPIVEQLTGWTGLLDDLKFEVADSLAPYMLREAMTADGVEPGSLEAKFAGFFMELAGGAGAGCAMYDPHIHTVIINEPIMEQVGIEALKIICGHELVHVGQYKYTPGLKAYNLSHMRGMSLDPSKVDQADLQKRAAYMLELEGYAKYIEADFLHKRYYPLGLMSYHASAWEQLLRALMAMLVDGTEEGREAKASQYSDGLEQYRSKQIGDDPVPFELDVGTLYGGEAFV